MQAEAKTCQAASQCCRFPGPGSSSAAKEPSPVGYQARNFTARAPKRANGPHSAKSACGEQP
eukprot:2531685-Pyramimonas_sp.AAC.1